MNTAKLLNTYFQKLLHETSQNGSMLIKGENIRPNLPFLALKMAVNVIHKAEHIVNTQHVVLKF